MSAKVNKLDENTEVATNPTSRYKITIKRDLCIGAASCVALAPDTFDLDGENIVIFKDGSWDPDDMILAAAQSCPVYAIIVEDLETGEQIFPDPTLN
jgi:ferredoxin